MITNLYEYFNYDFSDIENELISLIKKGWILVCPWIYDCESPFSTPTNPLWVNYYAGYFMYLFDEDNQKILQLRESISQDITGEISIEDYSTQATFVPDYVLKNMICNAHTSLKKSVFNPEPYREHVDDFFSQWTINEKEPDRMFLLEPTQNWEREDFDEEKWKEAEEYIFHWADKYPQYDVPPNSYYIKIVLTTRFLSNEGMDKKAIDFLYQTTPGLFYGYGNPFEEYCSKLKEKLGENYCQELNALYFSNIEKFREMFAVKTIEEALGYR